MGDVLAKVRNSSSPRVEYGRPASFSKQAFAVGALRLREWGERRVIYERLRFGWRYGHSEPSEVIARAHSRGTHRPISWGARRSGVAESFAGDCERKTVLRTTWRVAHWHSLGPLIDPPDFRARPADSGEDFERHQMMLPWWLIRHLRFRFRNAGIRLHREFPTLAPRPE